MSNAHKNIPFFIPHEGCTHACVFCSQKKITGKSEFSEVEAEIDNMISTVSESMKYIVPSQTQIAFFGGSFTGIDYERQIKLLNTAKTLADKYNLAGIRISTRPDMINDEILCRLKQYPVNSIELGIQSTSNKVLTNSNRGHNAADNESACRLIKKHGFELTGQMMIGLPASTIKEEKQTAQDIVRFGCDCTRIYPTVVFADTALYDLTVQGKYEPLTNDTAALRIAECLEIFIQNKVRVLKTGLQSSPELSTAAFGPKHPAIGEISIGKYYLKQIENKLGGIKTIGKRMNIHVKNGEKPKIIGQKRVNIEYLIEKYSFKDIKIIEDENLARYDININLEEKLS